MRTSRNDWIRYLGACVLTAACVFMLVVLPAVTTRAALPVLLLVVVVSARTWGTGPALMACFVALASYAYFFLPRDSGVPLTPPERWLALASFLAVALIVGELESRSERRRLAAMRDRLAIESAHQDLQAAFGRASEAEAERRNEQLKHALLEALTHSLLTPLTSIKASVTALLLRSGKVPLPDDSREDLLRVIDEETDRLHRFIDGLSTADSKDASFGQAAGPVSLDEIAQVSLARVAAVSKDHQVRVDFDADLPPLAVDAAAVSEVLCILLDNATKYAPRGTLVHLTASRLDRMHVSLTVADEGPGIPEEMRERVFEKFFRIPGREPVDPRRKGGGLGLSIARRLIETQAGRIWIETSTKGGTTVTMSLPAYSEVGLDGPVAGIPSSLHGTTAEEA